MALGRGDASRDKLVVYLVIVQNSSRTNNIPLNSSEKTEREWRNENFATIIININLKVFDKLFSA